MKDASKRSKVDTEEDDERRPLDSNKAEKQKRRKLRKRYSSCSPEEDVIDGFVIASYSSLHSLEVVGPNKPTSPDNLAKEHNRKPKSSSKACENGHDRQRSSRESKKEAPDIETGKNTKRKTNDKKPQEGKSSAKLLRQCPEQLTDDSSDSGNSEKGYICDGESEDEQVLDPEKAKPVSKEAVGETTPPKLSPSKERTPKDGKTSPIFIYSQRTVSSPKSLSPQTSSLSLAVSSSSLSFPRSCRPVVPQRSWFPQLSSSFQKPSSMIEPCYVPGNYAGPDALHQELNNRFLQSHSERERHSHSKAHEMHQHSHLHHHQHQHQHTHFYPTPLLAPGLTPALAPGLFPAPQPLPGMLSRFSAPVPTYGSHAASPHHKKTGKWCSAHVQIAWKIYYHQQRVQTEMVKDPHVKPEHVSISKSSTLYAPPFHARHVSPCDLGCHSPHLHSSRFSGSPFSKPSVFVARSHSSPYGSVVATTTSAFSSVVSPATTHRAASPSAIGTTSLSIPSATKTELERRPSNSVGPSSLYPWIKSETKDSSNERRDRADGDSEKTRYHMKSEIHRKSPSRQVKNFSIQALAGDRSETLRPRHAGTLDSSGSHIPREPRPTETRSFLDKPLLSLNTLDKRPVDYRTSTGSIDLNRNTLYPRFDPMMTVHSPHVNSLTPSVGLGYVYPGAPFLADSMYHSSLGQGMFLGSQDSMTSLGRTQDLSFYNET